jgi:ubiquinone/menaquinone biosynthesis C-methylase UbiE
VLAEAFRVLKPNGVIVLDIPDKRELDEKRDGLYLDDPGGEHLYIGYVPSEGEMIDQLERSGFTNIEVKKWVTHPNDRKAQHFPKLTFTAVKPESEIRN